MMKRKTENRRKLRLLALIVMAALMLCAGTLQASAETGALYDRNGELLNEDNLYYYQQASGAFSDYLAAGQDVYLSIDLSLQNSARELLGEYPDGCAVVLDVNSGAPLAIAAVGASDPLVRTYAPRQLFMPCVALASMNYGVIDADDQIACEGVFTRYESEGFAPECWIWNAAEGKHLTHSMETVDTALRDHCQYYFYSLGNELGIDALENYARSLGLGEKCDIELENSEGVLASRSLKDREQPWNIGDTLIAAVGEGYSAFSPLQLARYCAAIANGGRMYSASILNEVSTPTGECVYERSAESLYNVAGMEEYMWGAVRTGLYMYLNGYDSSLSSYYGRETMAGTNGFSTAEQAGEQLFMGFAPYYQPEIAIVVALDDAASPADAQNIAREIFQNYMENK